MSAYVNDMRGYLCCLIHIQTDTGEIHEWLDTSLAKLLWVTWVLSADVDASEQLWIVPIPERWRMSGELRVPPLTMMNFLAL